MQTKNINLALTDGDKENTSVVPPSKDERDNHVSAMNSSIYVPMPTIAKFRDFRTLADEFHPSSTSAPSVSLNSVLITSVSNGESLKGVYQPPPLPPRVGSMKREPPQSVTSSHVIHPAVSSIYTTTTVNASCNTGPYKPVPPPKPYAGPPSSMYDTQDHITHSRNGGPNSYPHILVTDQGQFVTHSAKFPISDESQKLVVHGNHRFVEGIDNPAMITDTDMRLQGPTHLLNKEISTNHYAQMNGCDSSRHPSAYVTNGQHQLRNHYGHPVPTMLHAHTNGCQPPVTVGNWPNTHSLLNHQHDQNLPYSHSPDKRQLQHPQQHQVNSLNARPCHLPPQSQQGQGRTISFAPGPTILNHRELTANSNDVTNMCNGSLPQNQTNNVSLTSQFHSGYMNGHIDRKSLTPQDDNATNVTNEDTEHRREEKWGSLKKAGKTYSHLKNIISNKFTKTESKSNGDTRNNDQSKTTATQGQNTNTNDAICGKTTEPEPQSISERYQNGDIESRDKCSFQRTLTYSSLKTKLEENGPQDSSTYVLPDRGLCRTSVHGPMNYTSGAVRLLDSRHQNEAFAAKRAGSCSYLGSQINEPPPQVPVWTNHHRSDENLSRILPSDLPYPDQRAKTLSTIHLPSVREGRLESDSGRGTGGSCTEFKGHDTSLESGSSNRPHPNGQSSGNESEWIDIPENDTPSKMQSLRTGRSHYRTGITTPPLPPLSPEVSPKATQRLSGRGRKQSHSFSSRGTSTKPDLLETTETHSTELSRPEPAQSGVDNSFQGTLQRSTSLLPSSVKGWANTIKPGSGTDPSSKREDTSAGVNSKYHPRSAGVNVNQVNNNWKSFANGGGSRYDDVDDEITSTDAALDLNSVLDGATEVTTDDELVSRDDEAYVIRRQLEGLEGMYSEVLKVLGRRNGRNGDGRPLRRRLHGSMSSLPSSVMSGRPPTKDKRGRVIDDRVRRAAKDSSSKSIHKRFQRLESHVVTLARSVAHLSSEMRTQHLMLQEMESIRNELASLRLATRSGGSAAYTKGGTNNRGSNVLWNPIENGPLSFSNPGKVKKLTQFFGDEPPLVRLFLRKLGYEKYANIFEKEKIGMLELPYMTEERLLKLGIPLGPRLRILQEAQGPIKREGNLSVYVV